MITLEDLDVRQAQSIATLAKTARSRRDELLGNVAEEDLGEAPPARGEHNPTGALGFEPLPAGAPQISALRDAITALSPAARFELYALMRIGQGHLAAKDLREGAAEADRLGDATISASVMEDADLHDHITKALYEADLS